MILQNKLEKYFFGYGLAIFPFLLIIGPLISEIFLILTIIFASYSIYKEKNFKYIKSKFFIFLSLTYFIVLISTLLNFYSFDISKSGIFYFRIPLFAISAWYILDRFQIFNKKTLGLYIIIFCLIISDALFQYVTGKNIIGNEILRGRISSFFGEELILGGFIVRLMPVFLVYLVMNDCINHKKINFHYIILISLSCLIVYLSGERTSFFLLILFFFSIFFINKYLRKFVILTISLLILFALLIPYIKVTEHPNPANRMFTKTLNQIVGKGEEQYEEHKKKIFNKIYIFSHDHHGHYLLSYQIFKEHPLIGTGVKGFRYLCRNKIYILEKNDGCSTHPHNTYIQILVSTGLIGLSLLIFAFSFFVREIFICKKKIYQSNNFNKYQTSKGILISAIFINLWPFIPSGNFFNNWLSMIYFYPIGYYLYFYFLNEKETS